MVLLPRWAPFHIYKMSSWSRAMLMPLAIINHFKPTRILPGEKQLHELYPIGTEQSDLRLPRSEPFWTWRNFFLRLDDVFKFLSPLRIRPLRRRALEEAERWMLERIGKGSDGLAAVFPAMLNSLIALRALGYSKTNPVYAKAEQFDAHWIGSSVSNVAMAVGLRLIRMSPPHGWKTCRLPITMRFSIQHAVTLPHAHSSCSVTLGSIRRRDPSATPSSI